MIYGNIKPDKEPARNAVPDQGESIGLMEPMIIGDGARQRAALTDLALDLAQKSAGFRRSLPESLVASLAFPATLASRWMPGLFPERTG
jgi:hypothetical protein